MWFLHALLHTNVEVCTWSMVLVLICHSLSSAVVIGWQSTTYQAVEGTATVQACAEVVSGAASIVGSITVQVSTNPGTALGRQINFSYHLFTF